MGPVSVYSIAYNVYYVKLNTDLDDLELFQMI